MSKLLYIKGNPKDESISYSLQVGRAFLEEYKKINPQDEIVEIDVYNANIPLIDEDIFNAWAKLQGGKTFDDLTSQEKDKITRFNGFTEEFMSASKYVFVTPLWNYSVPPMVKAYIDTICVAGKTFRYTEKGPLGLLNGKKAMHIQASGGIYSSGPMLDIEHGSNYIKDVCKFIGIDDVKTVFVEGMAQSPQKAEEIKNNSIKEVKNIAKSF